ncbi:MULTISPECIES: spherulation-specific family 4 protein [unclassified Streptomyces]|uniref:spherulation-specific family 4 protein n=1 Tax=unclassified Streptomyces TaxID=2593676 RepID=UPI00225B3157|nr:MULTISPECIES: spherulation-specific family 4 protein [unclassified Streptomyces]MCX5050877.1 spherulation-specific family 4 protein [Streptomyces sp. NBC_00474]MCX5061251.1 spherulation-specific family 4 protein [Streptomyces sp. NBC_00452]MCX5248784.1 spherulation-specific family 4 protein [Streptomyces sp. NBC_00201]
MPYLTSTRAGTASTDVRTGFGIPGYAHPLVAPTEWAELTRPGTPLHWVVLNVSDGPGSRPDPHCLEAAGRLRNAGVRVLGHLDCAYGARAFGEVISDAYRHIDWYQVDGFLLDRCPSERASLPEIRRTVSTLRTIRDGAHIVLGHGTHPHPGYADSADQMVTFRGPWSDYRWSQVAEWTAGHPPERFCHFVHGVPRPHLEEALRIARWQGASTIYFTDHTDRGGRSDPWATMPGYWDEIVSRIGTGVSE